MMRDGTATIVLCDGARRCHGRVLAQRGDQVVVDVCGVEVVFNARTGRAAQGSAWRPAKLSPASRSARGGA